jgi:hypothetical protein
MAAELAEESAAWDAALLEANGAWDTSKKHLMAFARGFPRLFLHETGMTAEEYLKMVEEDESADELYPFVNEVFSGAAFYEHQEGLETSRVAFIKFHPTDEDCVQDMVEFVVGDNGIENSNIEATCREVVQAGNCVWQASGSYAVDEKQEKCMNTGVVNLLSICSLLLLTGRNHSNLFEPQSFILIFNKTITHHQKFSAKLEEECLVKRFRF